MSFMDEYLLFKEHLLAGNALQAHHQLKGLINTYPPEQVTETLGTDQIRLSTTPQSMATPLFLAVTNQMFEVVQELLSLGVPVDKGLRCELNPVMDQKSPLMRACEAGNTELIRLLVSNNANLLQQTTAGWSVLMHINSIPAFELVRQSALEQNKWLDLIAQRTQDGKLFLNLCSINIVEQYLIPLVQRIQNLSSSEQELITTGKEWDIVSDDSANLFLVIPKFHIYAILLKAIENNFMEAIGIFLPLIPDLNLQLPVSYFVGGQSLTDTFTLLGFAAQRGKAAIARILIEAGADIYIFSDLQGKMYDTLMFASNLETACVIMDKAEQEGRLAEMVFDRITLNSQLHLNGAFQSHCQQGNYDVINEFMKRLDFSGKEKLGLFLGEARYTYLSNSAVRNQFDQICKKLQEAKSLNPSPHFSLSTYPELPINVNKSHEQLFHRPYSTSGLTLLERKAEEIDRMIAEFHALLQVPQKCMKYLKFLNEELLRYYEDHSVGFPASTSEQHYSIQYIDELPYPVPDMDYIGFKKEAALKKIIMAIFKEKYQTGKNSWKWIGIIPSQIADQQMLNGDFVEEANISAGIFHGKIAHMLQLIILIYALEEGLVNNNFIYEGQKIEITWSEFLERLTQGKVPGYNETLWQAVLDSRLKKQLTCSDPFRLTSTLINEGEHFGCGALAAYIRDGFCKGFLQYYHAFQLVYPSSLEQFTSFINDLGMHYFFQFPPLLESEIKKAHGKNRSIFWSSNAAAVVKLDHRAEDDFIPRKYEEMASLSFS